MYSYALLVLISNAGKRIFFLTHPLYAIFNVNHAPKSTSKIAFGHGLVQDDHESVCTDIEAGKLCHKHKL